MNFAIEVPGEAVPLNAQDLIKALHAGTSTDHNQRQSASQQLSEWEAHREYFPSLQTVFLDKTVPHQIRFLAIILLKNGIDKNWRYAATKNAIQSNEKDLIRSRLLQGSVDEEDRTFALHNALVTAKIMRIDYPQDWPEAIPGLIDLLRRVKDGNQAHLAGALLVLLHVVKELSSARLRRSQTALQGVAPELVYLLADIYAQKAAVWLEFLLKGRGDEDDADYAMQNSLTALKVLRRLIIAGYEYPHKDKLVQEFWNLSQTQFGQFLEHVSHDSIVPAPYQDVIGKHLLQFTKLHLDMCDSRPGSFPVLPNSVPLVNAYWGLVSKFAEVFDKSGGIRQSAAEASGSRSKVEGPLLERLALRGLLVLKSCITIAFNPAHTFKYRSKEVKQEQEQAVSFLKTELLTDKFVLQVVEVIITKLFIFRKSDLEAWEEGPEEWEAQERSLGDAWEWQVRPCAERVFVDLLIHYKALLGPPLLSYFQTAMSAGADIVTKEAVYTAMGSAVNIAYQAFDFDAFLASTLVKDAQIQDPLAKLLRRRIAILLSQWVPVKIADVSRPMVFEIYRHLMNKADAVNDEVVRITAARQLKFIADDFEFKAELFQPYAADTISQLVNLLQEIEVDETRLAILETVRVFINRMDTHVSQFSDQIISILPSVWDSAGAEAYMIKQSVLSILSTLVMSMRGDSQRFQANMLPIIAEAMNPASEVHQFLLDEAVEMWKSIMTQCSPPLSQELISLEVLALPLLEFDSRVAEDALDIVKSYILLAPEAILTDQFRRPTLAGLAKAMDSRQQQHVHFAAKSVQYIIRAAQEFGGSAGVSIIIQDMLETSFLPQLMEKLHGAWEAHQSTGPKAKVSKLSTVTEADLFSILSRIAIADPELFAKILSSAGDLASVWNWLSVEWFSAFDSMADIERQKLSCLALTRLCELPQPMQDLVLGKLQDYFSMWTTVIADIQEGDATGNDWLVWSEVPKADYETPLDARENLNAAKDPIHTEHSFTFVKLRLQNLIERTGGDALFEANWAVNVDKEILAGFQALSNKPLEI